MTRLACLAATLAALLGGCAGPAPASAPAPSGVRTAAPLPPPASDASVMTPDGY